MQRTRLDVSIWKIISATLLLAGCTQGASHSGSNVSVTFPKTAAAAARAASGGVHTRATNLGAQYDFSRACYALNVTSADIPAAPLGTCDVPVGSFQGFVAPGGSITMNVPSGTGRKLEVFSYLRDQASDPCPLNKKSLAGLPSNKLVRVGLANFDALTASVNVDVTLTDPGDTVNLISQYSLPPACLPTTPLPPNSAGVVLGNTTLTGSNYKMVGTVSSLQNETLLQGGVYQIRLSRRTQ